MFLITPSTSRLFRYRIHPSFGNLMRLLTASSSNPCGNRKLLLDFFFLNFGDAARFSKKFLYERSKSLSADCKSCAGHSLSHNIKTIFIHEAPLQHLCHRRQAVTTKFRTSGKIQVFTQAMRPKTGTQTGSTNKGQPG